MTGRPRIVIATPDRAECEILADWLATEGYEPVRAVNLRAAADELQARAFDLLVADYVFAFRGGLHAMSRGRARNPQTPTLIIGDSNEEARTQSERHHTTFVDRPIDRPSLVCMVSMIVMENRPARRSLRKPVHLDAAVDGVRAHVLDMSNEGVRLEILRRGRSTTPPYFNVRVPLVGVSLTVQRVWISLPAESSRADVGFCGGALADNPPRAGEVWRAFVDALPSGASAARIDQV